MGYAADYDQCYERAESAPSPAYEAPSSQGRHRPRLGPPLRTPVSELADEDEPMEEVEYSAGAQKREICSAVRLLCVSSLSFCLRRCAPHSAACGERVFSPPARRPRSAAPHSGLTPETPSVRVSVPSLLLHCLQPWAQAGASFCLVCPPSLCRARCVPVRPLSAVDLPRKHKSLRRRRSTVLPVPVSARSPRRAAASPTAPLRPRGPTPPASAPPPATKPTAARSRRSPPQPAQEPLPRVATRPPPSSPTPPPPQRRGWGPLVGSAATSRTGSRGSPGTRRSGRATVAR